MNNKPHKTRVEEQKLIYDFVEMIERYSNIAEFEAQGTPFKLTRHDGYTFSTRFGSGDQKLVIRFEVETLPETPKV